MTEPQTPPAGAEAVLEALRAHAEAMADALEDLVHAEHNAEIWARAEAAWQAYVDWDAQQKEGATPDG